MELCYKFSKCCSVGNSHHETHCFHIKKIKKRKPIQNRHCVRRPVIPIPGREAKARRTMAGGHVRSWSETLCEEGETTDSKESSTLLSII